jgi:glycosyltransferase involved in cell wall biosynthesis
MTLLGQASPQAINLAKPYNMKIIVYSETNEQNISKNYGASEYSYYFVLKEFLPVFKKIGEVITVTDPESEVDQICAKSRVQECVFLSFSPPHKTITDLQCPTIPVLAWEFEDIPTEIWDNDPRNDWRFALGKLGFAITHSSHAARTIRKAMRQDYPVAAIPAPVWDRYKRLYDKRVTVKNNQLSLNFSGYFIDTAEERWREHLCQNEISLYRESATTTLSGTIYTTVLNPLDGRKNWVDIITAFSHSFADRADATLLLKFTNKDTNEWLDLLIETLLSLPQHQCRIMMINGFIDDKSYQELARNTTYTVNASKGEGQCLPLMEYMSAGTPAISPRHTGMEDYINLRNSFIVESKLEPTPWPTDSRNLYRTYFHRINWESLVKCFTDSYITANENPRQYQKMASLCISQLEKHCSQKSVRRKLELFFAVHRNIVRKGEVL